MKQSNQNRQIGRAKRAVLLMWCNVKEVARDRNVYGIERVFALILVLLRFIAISYWLVFLLSSGWSFRREKIVEAYCLFQFGLLSVLAFCTSSNLSLVIVSWYVLFDIYLNLFNIVFIDKFPNVNGPPDSIELSLLLLFLNVIDVLLVSTVSYRYFLELSPLEALFGAATVLGTVALPGNLCGYNQLLVLVQILLDLLLIVLLIGTFASQAALFRKKKNL